jgi:hypothetical protein
MGLPPVVRIEAPSIDAIDTVGLSEQRHYIEICDYSGSLIYHFEIAIPFAHVMCNVVDSMFPSL